MPPPPRNTSQHDDDDDCHQDMHDNLQKPPQTRTDPEPQSHPSNAQPPATHDVSALYHDDRRAERWTWGKSTRDEGDDCSKAIFVGWGATVAETNTMDAEA